MLRQVLQLTLLLKLLGLLVSATNTPDEYLLETRSLPADLNFMPSLSNGHLGYTMFGDAIYINGVYNGQHGNSRRARLPNWLNLTISIEDQTNQACHVPAERSYIMNLHEGYFEWQLEYPTLGLRLTQRSYPHRFYNRLLVYELKVIAEEGTNAAYLIRLTSQPGNLSDAFDLEEVDHERFNLLKATTRLVEQEEFQKSPSIVYIAFGDSIKEEKSFHFHKGQQSFDYRFMLSIDQSKEIAIKEMEDALALSTLELRRKHSEMWIEFWQSFNITLKSNLELSQIINAGIFYMASSLPSLLSNQPNHAYGGLSPTGLARGQLDSDYEGHNFWDTEIWMLPVVTQFSTSWGQELLNYRRRHLEGAMFNANLTGYKGARFPWESAYTGTEVTNPCCPEVAQQQIHISADIVFALRQHYAVTNSGAWLCEEAWPLLKEIVTFLEQRTAWNATTDSYHVKDVMGPDEDHVHVDDNVYTNYVFKLAFEFADFTLSQCEKDSKPSNWLKIAEKLVILYDEQLDYHPQYEGYQLETQIKQADAILLGYPLQLTMNDSTRLHDLHYYASATRPSGPAMTWSMFAINFLAISELGKAHAYFNRSYSDYVRPEFKVWSEVPVGYHGSANFLTGVGGFLQAVMNGYGGLRFYVEGSKAVMELGTKYLLPGLKGEGIWEINGIKFGDSEFQLGIMENNEGWLKCSRLGEKSLVFKRENEPNLEVSEGFEVSLNQRAARVETLESSRNPEISEKSLNLVD